MGQFLKSQHFLEDLNILSSYHCWHFVLISVPQKCLSCCRAEQTQGWVGEVMHWCWQLAVLQLGYLLFWSPYYFNFWSQF